MGINAFLEDVRTAVSRRVYSLSAPVALGHADVRAATRCTHGLNRDGRGVRCPLDEGG